jgi:hypothetical protein
VHDGKLRIVAIYQKLASFVRSKQFFQLTLLVFIIETVWLAMANRFPMAFDEAYHFDLIVFFSHHWSPLITSQSSSSYGLGAIIHNPSFLYHYLLSFPYRLIAHFTQSLKTQVILIRFINIIFATCTLVMTRRILRLVGLSSLLSNIVIVTFALTPVLTQLSAQVNYDNLLLLLSSICIYWTLTIANRIYDTSHSLGLLLPLFILCLYASLVDFEFLPIFFGIVLYIALSLIRTKRAYKKRLLKNLKRFYSKVPSPRHCALLVSGLLGLVLFLNFYGYNTVKYLNPEPQCSQVLSIADCEHYYAWDRNYQLSLHNPHTYSYSFFGSLHYSYTWARQMFSQLFIAVKPTLNGGALPSVRPYHLIVLFLLGVCVLCMVWAGRQVFQNSRLLKPLTAVMLVYLLGLLARNYHDYVHLGQAVAIQGRYLLPVLAYIYGIFAMAVYYTLRGPNTYKSIARVALVCLVIISFVYFGGFSEYISKVTLANRWQASVTQKST